MLCTRRDGKANCSYEACAGVADQSYSAPRPKSTCPPIHWSQALRRKRKESKKKGKEQNTKTKKNRKEKRRKSSRIDWEERAKGQSWKRRQRRRWRQKVKKSESVNTHGFTTTVIGQEQEREKKPYGCILRTTALALSLAVNNSLATSRTIRAENSQPCSKALRESTTTSRGVTEEFKQDRWRE